MPFERSERGQKPDAVTSRLVLEYDGSAFAGWARQPGQRTIQEEVERALGLVLRAPGGFVPVTVAGRTDAGVHALGQVCSYQAAPVPIASLNALLPNEVAALSCEAAPDEFDARRDATSRAYCYRLLARHGRPALAAGRVLHWPHSLDLDSLERCAAALVGLHDFTAFTPADTEHVRFERDVYVSCWRRDGDLLEFLIEADAFMRHMNRVLVGTMLQVASGRRSIEDFIELLSGAPRERAGPTAAAAGLYLVGVGYGERVLA
jgi:tRNA pseudouridine38-40 synthase